MTGVEFYDFLRGQFNEQGKVINNRYVFEKWLLKKDLSHSFQFKLKNQFKSVPKNWIIDSKNAKNKKETVNRNWFNKTYNKKHNNDCRASVVIWLINNF